VSEPEGCCSVADRDEKGGAAVRSITWQWWLGQLTVLTLALLATYLVLAFLPPIGHESAQPVLAPTRNFSVVLRPDATYLLFADSNDVDGVSLAGYDCTLTFTNDRTTYEPQSDVFRQPPRSVTYLGHEYQFTEAVTSSTRTVLTGSCPAPFLVEQGMPVAWPRVFIAIGALLLTLAGIATATMRRRTRNLGTPPPAAS
jgi:hypothetical protein